MLCFGKMFYKQPGIYRVATKHVALKYLGEPKKTVSKSGAVFFNKQRKQFIRIWSGRSQYI